MNDQLKRDVDATLCGDGAVDPVELLDRFADAWNRHDLEALMSMMTDDCVFDIVSLRCRSLECVVGYVPPSINLVAFVAVTLSETSAHV